MESSLFSECPDSSFRNSGDDTTHRNGPTFVSRSFSSPFLFSSFFLLFLSTVIFFIFSLFFLFFFSFLQTLLQLWWIVFLSLLFSFIFFLQLFSLSLSLFATLVDSPIYMFLREISTVSFLRSSIVHEVFCLPLNPISVTFTGFPLPNFEDGFFTLTVIDRFHVGCSHVPLIGRSARDNRLGYWELDCEWITFNSALHFFGK